MGCDGEKDIGETESLRPRLEPSSCANLKQTFLIRGTFLITFL